jgi:gp16 family phage-associated protein
MNQPEPRFKDTTECHAWFRAQGINVSQWCRERKLSRQVVVDLLRGKRKGYRGEAHRAAVALGLKSDPEKLAA